MEAKRTFGSQVPLRPFRELPPCAWVERILSLSIEDSEADALASEIDELKPKVRDMLMSSGDAKKKILFIHLLVSLGVSYHFENEIEETLRHAFKKIDDMIANEKDLYTISVMFQVFRTYRHHMSSDVFKRFKGDEGTFKQCLITDVKGVLNLYEAAHWGTTAEDIMDEALSFTVNHLESLAAGASPHMSRLIKTTLDLPRRLNIQMLAAREYILYYEHEEDHDEMLLKFAKLNFNFLQLLYVKELKTVTKWWKQVDFGSKLPSYFRDNIERCYLYTMAVFLEPQFSLARTILFKFYRSITIFDDTCDRYASLREVTSFVDSVERWDPNARETLPDYLKIVFKFMLDVHEHIEKEVSSEGRSYGAEEILYEYKRVARANLASAKWAQAGHVPSFEEYLKVGKITFPVEASLVCCFNGMGQIAGKEVYEWLKSRPKLIQAIATRARLLNDTTGFKDDMSRGYAATGINVYMKQYGVTEEEAYREFRKMIRDNSKIMNEEFLKTSYVPWRILLVAINFDRGNHVSYRFGEGYTDRLEEIEEYMTSLFLYPIRL